MDGSESLEISEYTSETASKIQAINKDTVHRICSGQVVLSLAVAVKELVENSLDAGATVIEVRLKDYGQELIEVQDNGSGVTEENFSGLTLKYYTSKIREFSDLLGVSTFGFRGEALSSLCALSNLNVTTKHKSAAIGTKIVYDSKGLIKETIPCARQVGTTVSLSNLFSTLPVRQKEFHKNIKREFNKMTQLLYAYCLVSKGVKITCTNQTSKGNKTVVVATQGGSVRDNIACVFGVKQLQSLLTLKPFYPEDDMSTIKEKFFSGLQSDKINESFTTDEKIDVDDIKSDTELDLSEDSSNDIPEKNMDTENISSDISKSKKITVSNEVKNKHTDFDGFISTCVHGNGRSTTERQFFYINSRPCEPQKVMKVVNEIYKQYNPHQFPFVYLNIKVKRSSVDVNVTPDKRKIFLDKENYLLDVIKLSLQKIFENIPSTLKFENIKEIFSQKVEKNDINDKPRIFSSFLNQFSNKPQKLEENIVQSKSDIKRKAESLDNYVSIKTIKIETSESKINSDELTQSDNDSISESNFDLTNETTIIENETFTEESPNVKVIQKFDSGIDENDEPKEAIFLGYTNEIHLSQVVEINDVLPIDTKKQFQERRIMTSDNVNSKKKNQLRMMMWLLMI